MTAGDMLRKSLTIVDTSCGVLLDMVWREMMQWTLLYQKVSKAQVKRENIVFLLLKYCEHPYYWK
jgi:hypothetical protein